MCVCVCVCVCVFFFKFFSIVGYYKILQYMSLSSTVGLCSLTILQQCILVNPNLTSLAFQAPETHGCALLIMLQHLGEQVCVCVCVCVQLLSHV